MLIKLFKLLLYLFSNINSSSPKIMSFSAAVLLQGQSLPTCVVYWVCTVKIRKRGHSKILVKKQPEGCFLWDKVWHAQEKLLYKLYNTSST
jgi:hypothetical protein